MWEQGLGIVSLASAILSAALGIAFWVAIKRLGVLTAAQETSAPAPSVCVIVPARNEQDDIGQAVGSLLAQQDVPLHVIVVNDHSSDRTGEIADSIAASDDRVTVIHDPPLAEGWLGKANAMDQGLKAATDEYIVFTDADVVHSPRCFATALGEMERSQIDFLSLCPFFEMRSFWENVLLPHCFIAGTVHFCRPGINDPKSPHGVAAGAFMLMRRNLLERIGGLEQIKSEMLDDVVLARVVKRHGFDARFWLAPELLRVRLFRENSDAFWGLTKNILAGVDHIGMAIPAMFLPVIVYWVPLVSIVVALRNSVPLLFAVAAVAYAIQLSLALLIGRICLIRWPMAAFFPLAAVPVLCCFTKALYHRCMSGAVAWRGRVISIGPR